MAGITQKKHLLALFPLWSLKRRSHCFFKNKGNSNDKSHIYSENKIIKDKKSNNNANKNNNSNIFIDNDSYDKY